MATKLQKELQILDREMTRVVRDGFAFFRNLRVGPDGKLTSTPHTASSPLARLLRHGKARR